MSALFTGVNLLDNHGRLLVEGNIAGILASNHRNFGKYIKQKYHTNHYFLNLAASYGETFEVVLVSRVCFQQQRSTCRSESHFEYSSKTSFAKHHSPCVKYYLILMCREDSRQFWQLTYSFKTSDTFLMGL